MLPGFLQKIVKLVTTGFAAFYFARFLVVSAVTEFLEGPLFIHLLLQATEGTLDRFAFTALDFGHFCSPPLSGFDGGT